MAELIKLRWPADFDSHLPRRDREGCDYEAYVPDLLMGRAIALDVETAADVADAERAVARLNEQTKSLADSEAMARLLLRAEAVASSRIEGLEMGGRRLLRAQVVQDLDEERTDVSALEILNNIKAMQWAIDTLSDAEEITPEGICGIHARLLEGTRLHSIAGRLRDRQNWIGGSAYSPCAAAFVPPPSDRIDELLDDLCRFCNADMVPAVAQAALAHAQFETIHPFADGNGRTGRALIHVILRRRGLAPVVVPPISLVLATLSDDYIDGLTRTRYRGDHASQEAHDGLNAWIATFAAATTRAVSDAEAYEAQVAQMQAEWRSRLGRIRRDSAASLLIEALPGAPVVTVQAAAALIGRSDQATNEAMRRLEEAGVLRQLTVGRRNRAFEARELIDAFTDLERRLASPDAETRTSPPVRRVPYPPNR